MKLLLHLLTSLHGPSLQMWPHTYLVAIGANLLQNYLGPKVRNTFSNQVPFREF